MSYSEKNHLTVSLVGHPFAPIGMGEHVRCSYRAMQSVFMDVNMTDIYSLNEPSREYFNEFGHKLKSTPSDLNIFHINGDEVEQALSHLSYNSPWSGINIIYPAWELSKYPQEWARQLDKFDEIWAPSKFIFEGLSNVCKKPVFHMPLACEVKLSNFLPRRYFGIRETDYVFLFFFDIRSYVKRKNPEAIINAFRKVLIKRPFERTSLVLKINGSELSENLIAKLKEDLGDISDQVIVIDQQLTDNEVKNLVRCSDCFVSLHRSEGFGRGLAEAMVLGKPVIATGYSGNMDFTKNDNSLLVDYSLVKLAKGDYPFYKLQYWAEPDVDQAAEYMLKLLDNPEMGYKLGKRASIFMMQEFGYMTVGLNYKSRINDLVNG